MVVVAFSVVTIAVVDAPVKSWPAIAVPLTVLWPMITVVEVDGTVTLMMYVAGLEAFEPAFHHTSNRFALEHAADRHRRSV